MEKEEELDIRFEQIEALNAKVMNSKMILHTLRYQVNQAQQEGNEEKVEELNNRIEAQNKLIETHRAHIKELNGEIRSNWRQPEKKQEEIEDEEEIKIDIPQRKKIKWYNFIQRFKRWRDSKKQNALQEGQTEEKENNNDVFRDSLIVSHENDFTNPEVRESYMEQHAKEMITAYKKEKESEETKTDGRDYE